jgi:hypothetical protein
MMRRQAEGHVSPVHARISANATWLRGMIAVADAQEYRSQSGRSRVLASNQLSLFSSAAVRSMKEAFGPASEGRGWRAHDEAMGLSKGVLGKE